MPEMVKKKVVRLLLILSLLLIGLCMYSRYLKQVMSPQYGENFQSLSNNGKSTRSNSDELESDSQRITYLNYLKKYCHRSLLDVSASLETSFEGRLPISEDSKHFELMHVHVIARHGDRSPVTTHHIGSPIFYQCGLVDGKVNWNGLEDFPQPCSLPHNAVIRHTGINLHPGSTEKSCGVGQLTNTGFLQHHALGLLMRTLYKDFISGLFSVEAVSKNVFVQSTDFSRTIQSAAAFLLGFLPDDPRVRRAANIHVSANQGTLFLESPPPGIHVSYKHCKYYFKFYSACLERINFLSTREQLYGAPFYRFCSMFDLKCHRESYVTEFFDHVLSRGCHDQKVPLPCNKQGKCIDFHFANELASFADWTWDHRHTVNSSIVAVMPFLKHSVLEVMQKVIRNDSGVTSPKIVLSFAHDSTLVRILKALRVSAVEGWMPYASRLVFELWRMKEREKLYVRILFNGLPVTHTTKLPVGLGETQDYDIVEFSSWRDSLVTGQIRVESPINGYGTKHYQNIAADYDDFFGIFTEADANFALKHLQLDPTDKVVDIGGGTGAVSHLLWKRGNLHNPVLCVDPSQEMLEQAKLKDGVETFHATAEEFFSQPMLPAYDKVVIVGAVHHFTDLDTVFTGLKKHLSDDGCCVISILQNEMDPLFQALKDAWYAEVQGPLKLDAKVLKAIKSVGFKVEEHVAVETYTVEKSKWYEMLRKRMFSVLYKFSDEQIEDGVSELEERFEGKDNIDVISTMGVFVLRKN